MTPGIADLNLRLIPAPRRQRWQRCVQELVFSYALKGSPYLEISAFVRNRLQITDHIQIVMSSQHLAIRACQAKDREARRVNKSGKVLAPDLIELFGIARGERFRMPGRFDTGHFLIEIPDVLRERAEEGN